MSAAASLDCMGRAKSRTCLLSFDIVRIEFFAEGRIHSSSRFEKRFQGESLSFRESSDRDGLWPAPRLSQPLGPKRAVPTRTKVAPSSIATSKSPLMPMESWRIEIPGRPRAPSTRASSARARK